MAFVAPAPDVYHRPPWTGAALLDAFTVRCEPKDAAARLRARCGGLVDRVNVICHSRPRRNYTFAGD